MSSSSHHSCVALLTSLLCCPPHLILLKSLLCCPSHVILDPQITLHVLPSSLYSCQPFHITLLRSFSPHLPPCVNILTSSSNYLTGLTMPLYFTLFVSSSVTFPSLHHCSHVIVCISLHQVRFRARVSPLLFLITSSSSHHPPHLIFLTSPSTHHPHHLTLHTSSSLYPPHVTLPSPSSCHPSHVTLKWSAQCENVWMYNVRKMLWGHSIFLTFFLSMSAYYLSNINVLTPVHSPHNTFYMSPTSCQPPHITILFSPPLGGSWWPGSQSNDCKAKAMRDGQGSPPRQWKKKATPPYQQHCLTD